MDGCLTKQKHFSRFSRICICVHQYKINWTSLGLGITVKAYYLITDLSINKNKSVSKIREITQLSGHILRFEAPCKSNGLLNQKANVQFTWYAKYFHLLENVCIPNFMETMLKYLAKHLSSESFCFFHSACLLLLQQEVNRKWTNHRISHTNRLQVLQILCILAAYGLIHFSPRFFWAYLIGSLLKLHDFCHV